MRKKTITAVLILINLSVFGQIDHFYTDDGVVKDSTRVCTLIDKLVFTGGRVGINTVPVNNDHFTVSSLTSSGSATIFKGKNPAGLSPFVVNNNGALTSGNISGTEAMLPYGRSYFGVGTGSAGLEFLKFNGNISVSSDKLLKMKQEVGTSAMIMEMYNGNGGVRTKLGAGVEPSYFLETLGIGLNNPTAKLDVKGSFKLDNGTQGLGRVLTSDDLGNATWQVPGGGASITDSYVREASRKSEVFAESLYNGSLDFNSYILEGLYNVFGNGTYTNRPLFFNFVDGYLEVISTKTGSGSGGTGVNVTQIYTHMGSGGTQGTYYGKSFKRNRKNGVWSNWFYEPKHVACAVRNISGAWGVINDANHIPVGISNVTQSNTIGNPNFTLNLPFFKVGGISVTTDEYFAKQGVFVGNSVGLGPTFVYVHKQDIPMKIKYDGSVFESVIPSSITIVKETDFSYSFDNGTGYLTVTHNNLKFNVDDVIITCPTNLEYLPLVVSQTDTEFIVKFVDVLTNNVQTNEDVGMNINIIRTGLFQVPNSNLDAPTSNFWVVGLQH